MDYRGQPRAWMTAYGQTWTDKEAQVKKLCEALGIRRLDGIQKVEVTITASGVDMVITPTRGALVDITPPEQLRDTD